MTAPVSLADQLRAQAVGTADNTSTAALHRLLLAAADRLDALEQEKAETEEAVNTITPELVATYEADLAACRQALAEAQQEIAELKEKAKNVG